MRQQIGARSQAAGPTLIPLPDFGGGRISFGVQSGVDMATALEGLAACLRLAASRGARLPQTATITVDLRGRLTVDSLFDQSEDA